MRNQLSELAPIVDTDRALAIMRSQIARRRACRATGGLAVGAILAVGLVAVTASQPDDGGRQVVASGENGQTSDAANGGSDAAATPNAANIPDLLRFGVLQYEVVKDVTATVSLQVPLTTGETREATVTVTNDSPDALAVGAGLPRLQTLFDDGAGNVVGGSIIQAAYPVGYVWPDVAPRATGEFRAIVAAVAPGSPSSATEPPPEVPLASGSYRMWLVLPGDRVVLVGEPVIVD